MCNMKNQQRVTSAVDFFESASDFDVRRRGLCAQSVCRQGASGAAMISEKRRREIISEFGKDAKRFAEAWRLASAYAQAGDMVMHDFFMAIMQPSRFQHTPEEKAWVQASMMEGASKRRKELLAEAAERLMHVF